jgi:hypothetical protein
MTRSLLAAFAAFLLLVTANTYAQQACNPDPQYTDPDADRGVYPDSATNFGPAYAGTPYMQLVTVVVPPDTIVSPFLPPIPFDSIVLASATGFPAGFTYACWNTSTSPNRCAWKGNTIGCISITGNPTIADTGTYDLTFVVNAYVGGSGTPQAATIDYYKIVVNPPLNVSQPEGTSFTVGQNEPNPFRGKTRIAYSMPSQGEVKLVVYNMLGKQVYSTSLAAQKGQNHFELAAGQLSPGIYMYSLTHGSTVVTKRMVVEGK